MHKRRFWKSLPVAGACCWLASASLASPEALKDARATIKEWVAVENALSREEAAWAQKEALLNDLIEVAEKRIQALDTRLEQSEGTLSAAETERAELTERQDALGRQAERVAAFLEDLERDLLALRPMLPPPLLEETEPLFQSLSQAPAPASRKLGERAQTVIGLIEKMRQFDQGVAVHETLQTLPGRDAASLTRTLYVGLGQAYYLSAGDAGYGRMSRDGWQWESRPELAEAVAEAMAAANGESSEPRLIELPVQLANEGAGQ